MSERPDMLMELVVDAERRWDAAIAMLAVLEALVLDCEHGYGNNVGDSTLGEAHAAIAKAKAAGFGG